jgi:hypothetical protein
MWLGLVYRRDLGLGVYFESIVFLNMKVQDYQLGSFLGLIKALVLVTLNTNHTDSVGDKVDSRSSSNMGAS